MFGAPWPRCGFRDLAWLLYLVQIAPTKRLPGRGVVSQLSARLSHHCRHIQHLEIFYFVSEMIGFHV